MPARNGAIIALLPSLLFYCYRLLLSPLLCSTHISLLRTATTVDFPYIYILPSPSLRPYPPSLSRAIKFYGPGGRALGPSVSLPPSFPSPLFLSIPKYGKLNSLTVSTLPYVIVWRNSFVFVGAVALRPTLRRNSPPRFFLNKFRRKQTEGEEQTKYICISLPLHLVPSRVVLDGV